MNNLNKNQKEVDVFLIGAGIMSTTLGVYLKELNPNLKIEMHERLGQAAQESSNAWNNAGTGHAALCELNYTPEKEDGTIDITKALEVNTEFDLSRQLWSYLVKNKKIDDPQRFIHPVPHFSFVRGDKDVTFLKKRYETLTNHHCYYGMEFTQDPKVISNWAPLVMENRKNNEPLAMTRMKTGTDVDYGSLTHLLFNILQKSQNFNSEFNSEVRDLKQNDDKTWTIKVKNLESGHTTEIKSKFLFIGAGGAAVNLLHKSGIPEGQAYAGFPVSGIWLRTDNQEICKQHNAKVYGQASVGSPPMSVPHLDKRHIDGKESLLFGPFAGFSTKFLKHGSYLDLFRSFDRKDMMPLMSAGWENMDLTKYLIGQVLESNEERMELLRTFFPDAKNQDWRVEVAGQRVQIIKPDPEKGGKLEFGTELVSDKDNSLLALLGASPGASTASAIALKVLEKCFSDLISPEQQLSKLKEIIPSYGQSLIEDDSLCKKVRAETASILNINNI